MSEHPSRLQPTPLSHAVHVLVKTEEECVDDPLLAELSCQDGPVAESVQGKISNLLNGNAWPQTVAYLIEEDTDTLVALATVCLDGHPNSHTFRTAHTRRIAHHPHVNVLVRDDRFRNRVLLDGRTRMGTAALHAILEVILRERPDPQMGGLPLCWAFVDPDNHASLRAFGTRGFLPRKAKPVWHNPGGGRLLPIERDLVVVRAAGKPLPPAPPPHCYRPVLDRRERASEALGDAGAA